MKLLNLILLLVGSILSSGVVQQEEKEYNNLCQKFIAFTSPSMIKKSEVTQMIKSQPGKLFLYVMLCKQKGFEFTVHHAILAVSSFVELPQQERISDHDGFKAAQFIILSLPKLSQIAFLQEFIIKPKPEAIPLVLSANRFLGKALEEVLKIKGKIPIEILKGCFSLGLEIEFTKIVENGLSLIDTYDTDMVKFVDPISSHCKLVCLPNMTLGEAHFRMYNLAMSFVINHCQLSLQLVRSIETNPHCFSFFDHPNLNALFKHPVIKFSNAEILYGLIQKGDFQQASRVYDLEARLKKASVEFESAKPLIRQFHFFKIVPVLLCLSAGTADHGSLLYKTPREIIRILALLYSELAFPELFGPL